MSSKKRKAGPKPTGLATVDALALNDIPTLQNYLDAVSEYILDAGNIGAQGSKAAQIALSAGLGRCLREELVRRRPSMNPHAAEINVAGALRTARADVSESHQLDGLRLAVEIKPVNHAVGRALWNRFGDVRAFAVNIHLKFPFAVVGGILAVPTWEWAKVTKTMIKDAAAAQTQQPEFDGGQGQLSAEVDESEEAAALAVAGSGSLYKKPTFSLLTRLIARLQRIRRRETEADAAHLLEAVAVIVYDPDTAQLDSALPPTGSGLRWDEFVDSLVETYDLRFE